MGRGPNKVATERLANPRGSRPYRCSVVLAMTLQGCSEPNRPGASSGEKRSPFFFCCGPLHAAGHMWEGRQEHEHATEACSLWHAPPPPRRLAYMPPSAKCPVWGRVLGPSVFFPSEWSTVVALQGFWGSLGTPLAWSGHRAAPWAAAVPCTRNPSPSLQLLSPRLHSRCWSQRAG